MKLPAIEIPDESSDKARQWAYRLAVLPFESTVEDVALLIQAAMADRGTCRTCRWLRVDPVAPGYEDTAAVCAHESEAHPLHWCQPVGNPETFGCTYHELKEAA